MFDIKLQKAILIRYMLTGAVNTVFGYGVFVLLILMGLHYAIALFLATLIGVLFNFKTLGKFVFSKTDGNLIWRFLVIYALLYILNVICVFGLLHYVHNVYLANAMALILISGIGFFLNRSFVYANH